MENKVIAKEYVDKNYVHKNKIREIVNIRNTSNKELVNLPNGEIICLSDCAELIDYLEELLEDK